jgi:DNA polymerase (family 10)
MKNQEIAKIFYAIADMLEVKGVPWKPIAYRKAARSIESMSEDIEKFYKEKGIEGLEKIPGVGKDIAQRIVEYLKTGKIEKYEKLKKSLPVNVEELMSIEGIGPKTIKLLYKKLKVKNLKDLEKAARAGKLRNLPRFGEKSEENILKSIEFAKKSGERKPLGYGLEIAEEIVSKLKKLKEINKIQICGSTARKKETIGDIDILITTKQPTKVMDFFTSMDGVSRIIAKGPTKSTIVYGNIQVDLRVVDPKNFGSAVQYFVGSKEHNVALRRIAISKGYKLSEYGLFKGNKRVAGEKEEDIYKKLGMDWIPYELRENRGEIEAAQKHKLPKLVEIKDVISDLQMHTKYSDGSNTVEEMALANKKKGLKYIAITDHVGRLKVAHAMSLKDIRKQRKEIDKLNSKFKNFKILQGAEVDINLDGSLAATPKMLKELDIVLGAIHSGLKRSKKEQTKRIISAIESGYVNIIAHPTGRIINMRQGYELDWDKVFEAALKNNVALEINAFPTRMDLNDIHARAAMEAGVMLSIGTDSHSVEHLRFLKLGAYIARRAWCEKKHIINTLPLKKLKKKLGI